MHLNTVSGILHPSLQVTSAAMHHNRSNQAACASEARMSPHELGTTDAEGRVPVQDYLRDAPANDRTAQALQGLTFGGGGEGIGLRIGGLLQAQAQAQFGGDLAQQARHIPCNPIS